MNISLLQKALFGVLLLLVISLLPVAAFAESADSGTDGFEEMNGTAAAGDSARTANDDDWFQNDTAASDAQVQAPPTVASEHAPVYPLIPVGGATLLLYLITWILARFKKMKTATHRKIWNVVLLITFMVSGLMGLVLVVQINYDVLGSFYSTFMWLHVDFGIVMAIVSIFHACWHTKYYGTLFKKK